MASESLALNLVSLLSIQILDCCHAAKSTYSPYNSQARLYSEEGHLFVVGGIHSNITLKTSGDGFVNINNHDLLHITEMAAESADFVNNFKQNVLPEIQSSQAGTQLSLLMNKLRRLEEAISAAHMTGPGGNAVDSEKLRLLKRRVNILSRAVQALRLLLLRNECDSGPCQNGGSCQDLFNGFQCYCTPQWEGSMCQRDVNECTRLAGTDLGCQNGGTCRNLAGSYACTCPVGWFGLHCTQRNYDCSYQTSSELCGHGVCVNQGGIGRGFVCMCDQGWTKREVDGSCTIDVDECTGPHSPCSHDPHVECVNTAGSFQCSPCPIGYRGNGYQCADVDECQINNGGCSTSPMVQCINTRGSRVCGPCPPGYSGDGTICIAAGGRCKVSNGGCHPKATCLDNPALSYVQCICPPGYVGLGIGPNGCLVGSSSPNDSSICYKNPCRNGGTCIAMSPGRYMCQCRPEFSGPNCTVVADPCSSSPCKNGGTCRKRTQFRLVHFQCTCPEGYTGPTCAMQNEGCIRSFYNNKGSITFPADNRTTWKNRPVTCAWTLFSFNRTQVINVTFTRMSFGSNPSSKCYDDYIEIYDGAKSSAPLFGRYCGSQLPPPVISNHSQLFITLELRNTLVAHISFNWTSVPRKCGGFVNATKHGTISSPGSPGVYPTNAHCLWKILALPGKRIRFTFFSLDIESHRKCNFDYLEIRNGIFEKSPILRKLCNSILPEPILTSGNEALLIFHSDSSRSAKGFQISYSPVEGQPGCGGTFTAPRGVIIAPSKPGGTEYLEDLSCEWLISLPQSEKIRIDIESLNLERSIGCNGDYLTIFDGPSRESGEVGRWCGSDKVPPFTSTSNEVLVLFVSDSAQNGGGFLLKYKSVCGGLWSAPSGIIQSPYYPFHYPEDRFCIYTIQQPLHFAIKLDFIDFDLEISEKCIFDYAMIYNGIDETSPLIGKYCGSNKPGQIVSKNNYLHIVLYSDASKSGRGFKANYTAIDIGCGGIITGTSGTIHSPKYPQQYPSNKECTWVISAPSGSMIQLTWLSFNLEKSHNCEGDWVAVYDNNSILAYSGQLGNKYCGDVIPPAMTASSNLITIVLHTDNTVSAPGFSAAYSAVDNKRMCGGNFFTVMGEIHSPNFPNGYPDKLNCQWTITVPDGQQIELIFEDFNLDGNGKCIYDYLEIRNGGYKNSPLINRYCGSKIDKSIISMSNQLYLRFVSDMAGSAPGFKVIWNGAIIGCGGILTSPSGSIISPNYPQPYGKNGECTYKIAVSQGSVIQLIIIDLDLEEHSICALDYVEIYDGSGKMAPKLAKICSQNHPPSLTSHGNRLFIFFRSDISRQGRGFNLKYSTVCNKTIKGFSGTIESPGFPDKDSISRECFWKIKAPIGNKINITFSHYQFGGAEASCDNAYLKIFEGSSGSSKPNHLLGEFCNSTVKPFRLASSANEIYVYFRTTDNSYYETVFRFEWIVSGCGGVFKRQKNGELSSPGYPQAYPNNVVCEWYLSVPFGSSITITVDDLQFERSEDCTSDLLEIYGGSDDTAPRLAKLCKTVTQKHSAILTTSGNNGFIRFKTDNFYKGRGFHAVYHELPNSRCGGEFLSESGLIHSHYYPQNYDPHDDCVFLIRVRSQHRINLTFTDFDINAADGNCTNGFVKVYDGESENYPLLRKICGNALPPSIISTSNKIFIRHKSDGFAAAKGFSALYSTVCGATFITNSYGTLAFSETETGLNWNHVSECKWIIRSTKPNSKITVQFAFLEVLTMFDISMGKKTTIRPGVNIFAGDDIDAPYYGLYSQNKCPPAFVIPSSVITVVYKASDMGRGRFIMDYSVQDTSCGGSLRGKEGIISSPKSPDPYPNNVECVWSLIVAPGGSLLFQFTKFDLQQSESCNDDYVEVRQNSESGPLLGVFCGSTLPRRIQSNATLWMKFRSGPEGTAAGFTASYSLAPLSDVEGFVGQIGSPFYPLSFNAHEPYSWRITVKPGHVIRIAFTEFHITQFSDNSDECWNSLMVFDGFDGTAPLLKMVCGYAPQPFSTGSNVAYLTLHPVVNAGDIRFLLDWMQIEKDSPSLTSVEIENGCKTFVEMARGENASYNFTSPGYPEGYKNNLNCEWIFQAPPGDHVRLTFNDIHLESDVKCSADSLTIYYGEMEDTDEEWTKVDKLCGHNDTVKIHDGTGLVKVVFKSDISFNETGFSGKAETACGGTLHGPNGVISEGPLSTCQWNITVKPGRTIKVSFTKFNLYGAPPCNSGSYIILRDGGRPDSPLLGTGKYCGTSLKDINIPETTSNRLFMYYKNIASEGIIMKFEEKSISCGGDIMLSKSWISETISSPDYPNIPPPHTECIWRILASSGESISFELTDRIEMAPSSDCTVEYLELRDGSTENSQLIGRYCSNTPNYITTEGNALYVKYFTYNDPKGGFRGTATMSKCGGTLFVTSSGSIQSPNYPQSYESNLNCTWKLITAEHKIFILNITASMGWDRNSDCKPNTDTVTVAEIMKENISLEGFETISVCGIKTKILLSETNEILIKFLSYKQTIQTRNRYFIVTYVTRRQPCGGALNFPSGVIRSLGYPRTMIGYCTWKITVPEGKRVTLNLIDFDMEKRINSSTHQKLDIYNGFNYLSFIATLTGDMPKQKVYQSSGNQMYLVYLALSGNAHRGFIANYTSHQPAICGGKMDATKNGSLSMTPKQNETFLCEWEYFNNSPLTPSTITFIFTGMVNGNSKNYSQSCYGAYSFILVKDEGKIYGKFCSETKPNMPFIVSKPNDYSVLKMVKRNMQSVNKNASFNISWKIDSCGAKMKEIGEVVVRSPGNATYLPNIDCVWSISAPEGSVLKIHFDKFDLETDCSHDYLKIFNGNSPRSPLISHHCGNIIPHDITTQSNMVWLLFHSDASVEKSGFKLTVTQIVSGCGGILHGKNGLIQSPNYPSNYKNNIECDWEIRADTGFYISLLFEGRFFIENSSGCQRDFIEISDYVNGQWKLLSRTCGREIPTQPFNSTSNRMRIFFKTNNDITGDGFKAVWNYYCGGVINVDKPGHIYSPGWPNDYSHNLDCNYTLLAPKKIITAGFETFSLEEASPQGCVYDKVQIWRKIIKNEHFRSFGIYCDNNKPPDVKSVGAMVIHFTTDAWQGSLGFSIAYDIGSCGGDITEETVISSPKIEDMYFEAKCSWNITAPPDQIVVLKLTKLRLHYYRNCSKESLEIWDTSKSSDGTNGTLLAKLCGAENTIPVFRSKGNKMRVDFNALYFRANKGISAIVSFTYGDKVGCGGTYSLSGSKTGNEKIITNPDINNDGKYENNMDCHWVVSTPSDSSLIVNFVKMDLKPCKKNTSKTSCCDALEVYDGPSERNELINRYCGTFIPRSLTSSSNYISFRFFTDGIGQAGGFKISVSPHNSICGTSVLTVEETPKFLTSPNYPVNYPINLHCRWIIVGDQWKIINIHFIDLEVEETSDCNGDRLEIFDESAMMWKHSEGNNDTHRMVFVGKRLYSMTSPQPSQKNMFCGKGLPLDYYSSSNRVMMRFISDSQTTSKGFKIQYSYASCNRNYTSPNGRIFLRGVKKNCTITITAIENRTISMYFKSLSISKKYGEENICINRLEIYEGKKKLNEICGWSAVPPIFSKSNMVTLQMTVFESSDSFDMSYTTTDKGRGCGGSFYNEAGALTSPMYPGNYRNYSYCCWEITVPLPGVPSIEFYEFDLGLPSTCNSDYVELYDVTDSGENIRRTSYCGGDQPARFEGRGQTVAICYMTSIHNSGLGWSVRWSTVANVQGEEVSAVQSGQDTG